MIKELGKISHVHFGFHPDRPFLFGLELSFSGSGWGVETAGAYMINMSEDCKAWKDNPAERQRCVTENLDKIREIMKKANIKNIASLKGIPVEVTFNDDFRFESFRVLEEVL